MGGESSREARSHDSTGLDARAALRDIAKPRLAGTEGAAEVGATIRSRFEALGYSVERQDFEFSPWPGRIGISVAGGAYLVTAAASAGFLYAGNPFGALILLLLLLVVTGAIALFAGPIVDLLPVSRMQGTNFMAVQPGSRPRYLVMAHRDSKSQPVPLSFRGPAVILAIAVWIAMLVGSLLATAEPLPTSLVIGLGVAGIIAGIILVFCYVSNDSPGALDNASGVAAALGIAARERDAGDVAFLITDAEELGLAGARAAATSLPPVFGVINLDGLDDDGPLWVLERFGFPRKQGLAPHLAAAILAEAEARDQPADRRDVPFGIPLDHMPIVRAGVPALTLMRGTFRSLRRVHTSKDSVDRLRGDGVELAIEVIGGALGRLREQAAALERGRPGTQGGAVRGPVVN